MSKKTTTGFRSKLATFSKRHPRRAKAIPIVLVAIAGISTLLISQAATFSVALEPELASTKTGVTTPTGDSTASGGSYVQFGNATPVATDYPTAATTGWQPTGVTLTAYTGSSTPAAGAVIDGKDISTCLTISNPNITIKRSRIKCAGEYGINQDSSRATNLLIEDTEITSTTPGPRATMVNRAIQLGTGSATIRRIKVVGTIRGIWLGSNTTVEDSYIGNMTNPGSEHTTAIVSFGTADHVTIRHNTLRGDSGEATAALALERDYGISDDYTIDNNLLAANGGYCFYAGASNIRFTNNKFSTEFFANCGFGGHTLDWNIARGGQVWTNNSWYDGPKAGQQVPMPPVWDNGGYPD